jgi:hypothetical protein
MCPIFLPSFTDSVTLLCVLKSLYTEAACTRIKRASEVVVLEGASLCGDNAPQTLALSGPQQERAWGKEAVFHAVHPKCFLQLTLLEDSVTGALSE